VSGLISCSIGSLDVQSLIITGLLSGLCTLSSLIAIDPGLLRLSLSIITCGFCCLSRTPSQVALSDGPLCCGGRFVSVRCSLRSGSRRFITRRRSKHSGSTRVVALSTGLFYGGGRFVTLRRSLRSSSRRFVTLDFCALGGSSRFITLGFCVLCGSS
jgi:hypothetical protein